MTHDSIQSPDPNHKYDFDEPVFVVPLGEGGVVEAISHKNGEIWLYWVSRLSQDCDLWWAEDQLQEACPHCLMPWDGTACCPSCGAVLD